MCFRKRNRAGGTGCASAREKHTAKIYSLSPNDRLDQRTEEDQDYPIYEEHLKEAFCRPELHNIAVTGDHGVGKSSIVRTFDRKRNSLWPGGRHFLYISLINFRSNAPHGPEDADNHKQLEELERDLLCQLLYVCNDVRKVPGITYRLIPAPKSRLKQYVPMVMLILLAAGVFGAAYFPQLRTISGAFLSTEAVAWCGRNAQMLEAVPYGLVLLCLLFFVGKLAGWLFRGAHLSKLTLEGSGKAVGLDKVGVDIQPVEGTSYLDRHGFELIYTLERMSGRFDHTVVFEDMDRLGTDVQRELFAELREINSLVNSRLSYKRRGPFRYLGRFFPGLGRIPVIGGLFREPCLRFIYVAHDMAFVPEECAKFFDYILPVVPALSRESLAVRLSETYLKQAGIQLDEQSEDIRQRPSQFLACAAPELNDYRTIHTIMNEYRVFEQVERGRGLVTTQADRQDLFAYVTYKNLCPEDYYRIREGRSTVFPPLPRGQNAEASSPLIQDWLDKGFLPWDCILFAGYSLTWLEGAYEAVLTGRDAEKKRALLRSCTEQREQQKGLCLDILAGIADDGTFDSAVKDIQLSLVVYLLNIMPVDGKKEAVQEFEAKFQEVLGRMMPSNAGSAEQVPALLEESVIWRFGRLTRESRLALVRCLLSCQCPLRALDQWLFRTDGGAGEAVETWLLLGGLRPEEIDTLIEPQGEAAYQWITSPVRLRPLQTIEAGGRMLPIIQRIVPAGKSLPPEVGEMMFTFCGDEEKPLQQWLNEAPKAAAAGTGQ